MRGEDQRSEGLFSYVRLETRIPADHPLRPIRDLVDAALQQLSRDFDKLYSREGRPSIPPRNTERNFRGEKRLNDTHSSTTDPDARLFRKGFGKEAKLCHMGHLMTENRNGLIVDARLTQANGTAECTTALDMIDDNASPGSTIGGDKGYDNAGFVAGCRERDCVPHVAQNITHRRSAIDARTTRHPGYRISMVKRKQIEEPFGWMKTVGGLRKTRHRGRDLVEWFFVLTATAYNLVRIPRILADTG
jgi:hypothetical protein